MKKILICIFAVIIFFNNTYNIVLAQVLYNKIEIVLTDTGGVGEEGLERVCEDTQVDIRYSDNDTEVFYYFTFMFEDKNKEIKESPAKLFESKFNIVNEIIDIMDGDDLSLTQEEIDGLKADLQEKENVLSKKEAENNALREQIRKLMQE